MLCTHSDNVLPLDDDEVRLSSGGRSKDTTCPPTRVLTPACLVNDAQVLSLVDELLDPSALTAQQQPAAPQAAEEPWPAGLPPPWPADASLFMPPPQIAARAAAPWRSSKVAPMPMPGGPGASSSEACTEPEGYGYMQDPRASGARVLELPPQWRMTTPPPMAMAQQVSLCLFQAEGASGAPSSRTLLRPPLSSMSGDTGSGDLAGRTLSAPTTICGAASGLETMLPMSLDASLPLEGAALEAQRRERRILSNRASAARSRQRKLEHAQALQRTVGDLMTQLQDARRRLEAACNARDAVAAHNAALRARAMQLASGLQR